MIPERWEQIVELVDAQGDAKVADIACRFGISLATARRDLAQMQKRGLLTRTRGGAVPALQVAVASTLVESRGVHAAEKERIGRAAAALVQSGDTLMMDGGVTTYHVARHLQAQDVTVVSNSLDVVQVLAGRGDVTLLVLGGQWHAASGTATGAVTAQQILQLRADKAILGADAVSPGEGLSCPTPEIAQAKKAMIQAAREVIVVADHSKLDRVALYHVAAAQRISTLITDADAAPDVLDAFRAAGVQVVVAT
ncbi:MAG: hypothetical protein A3K19_16500 [Lentisphaerae bacterium RIFOXYB12_FULL_65_16]|nr:MAG: hypothetical protein A3K18_24610 [Lentisphaerae bacterium RIFOXYA12_64_32]OGV89081.1 MAG: hypothetical protein A3K19_16500 [Lentisphaerae bacterium RIFOXYB12_FULL_65_16]